MKNFSFFKPFAILCVFFTGQNELFGGLGCSGGDCRDRRSATTTPTPVNRDSRREIADFTGRMPAPRVQAPSHSPQAPRQQVPLPSSSFSSAPVPGVFPSQPVPFRPNARPKTPAERDDDMERVADKAYWKTTNPELDHSPSARSRIAAFEAQQRAVPDSDAQTQYLSELIKKKEAKAARMAAAADLARKKAASAGAIRAGTPDTLVGYSSVNDAFGFRQPIGFDSSNRRVHLDQQTPATELTYKPGDFQVSEPQSRITDFQRLLIQEIEDKKRLAEPVVQSNSGFPSIMGRFEDDNPQQSGPSTGFARFLDRTDAADPFNPTKNDYDNFPAPKSDGTRVEDLD